MSDLPEPVPAATLVLMREAKSGPPQLLVMERTGHMAFAAGALVFPGGRIDAEDRVEAELFAGTADTAARLAASRETLEERYLERLARFGSIEEARVDAARHPVSRITPWVENRDGAPHVCIPDNIGYPVTSEPLETARRR